MPNSDAPLSNSGVCGVLRYFGSSSGRSARATVARAVFDHNRELGVFAIGAGTVLTLTDVLVKDTQREEFSNQFGDGLMVLGGARVTAQRAVFDHNHDAGVFAEEDGTELTLTDVLVKDTQSGEDGQQFGQGLVVLTKDTSDFLELHELIQAATGRHPGIILAHYDNDASRDMKTRDIVRALSNLERSGFQTADQLVILNQWR